MIARLTTKEIDQLLRPFQATYSHGPFGGMQMSPVYQHRTLDDAIAFLQREMERHPENFYGHVGRNGETVATVTEGEVMRCDVTERPEHAPAAHKSPESDGRGENGSD